MRLIDADELKEKLKPESYWTYTHEYGDAIPVGWAMSAIDNAPTVRNEYIRGYEAAMREYKRPQGEWVFDTNVSATVCSRCGGTAPIRISFGVQVESNYCPDCGAKMKGDAE